MTTELRTKTTGKVRTAPRRQTVRKARFDVRMTDESKELLMKAAALRNVNLSDFILGSAQREAEQVLAAHHAIALSERDSRLFVEAPGHLATIRGSPDDLVKRFRSKCAGLWTKR